MDLHLCLTSVYVLNILISSILVDNAEYKNKEQIQMEKNKVGSAENILNICANCVLAHLQHMKT